MSKLVTHAEASLMPPWLHSRLATTEVDYRGKVKDPGPKMDKADRDQVELWLARRRMELQPVTGQQLAETLRVIQANYRPTADGPADAQALVVAWKEVLGDVPADLLEKARKQYMASGETFAPNAGQLRALIAAEWGQRLGEKSKLEALLAADDEISHAETVRRERSDPEVQARIAKLIERVTGKDAE